MIHCNQNGLLGFINLKVTSKNMKNFLLEMKCDGYTLIGIEQTANSAQLNTYTFPSKSVLVLG